MSPEEKMMLDKGQKDIVKFDNTMKSFHIGKEEVEKFMDNLETNFPKLKRFKIKLGDQVLGSSQKFHVMLLFTNSPGSTKWWRTVLQLRTWATLSVVVRDNLAVTVTNSKERKDHAEMAIKKRRRKTKKEIE